MKGSKLKVIVIPVARCNLSCAYCYISAPTAGHMDDVVLHTIFDKVFQYNGVDTISEFIWHGFEPLLAGRRFYEKVITIQKQEFGHFPVANYIQTNGTLLTSELAEFFISNGFRLGISLDGPQFIHDEHRKYPNGKKTFIHVMKAINLIREIDTSAGVIGVLTPFGAENIVDIYSFFKRERLEFDLLPVTPPVIPEGTIQEGTIQDKALRLSPKGYAAAAIKLFDLWLTDSDPPQIRSCDSWTSAVLGTKTGQECTFLGDCFVSVITVDSCGDVWPCDRFTGVDAFKLGNILVDSITGSIIPKAEVLLEARRKLIGPLCSPCPVFTSCQGGCPHQAYAYTGDYRLKDYFCEAYKVIFPYIKSKVEAQIDKAYPSYPLDRKHCDM